MTGTSIEIKNHLKTFNMRKLAHFTSITALLVLSIVLSTGCKKKKDDPVPVFTMAYDSVSITGGGKGLQFTAICTNNDITMTKVTVKNPDTLMYIYQPIGASYGKGLVIPLQATNTAYPKKKGTWKLNLAGNSGGGTGFAIDGSVAVDK